MAYLVVRGLAPHFESQFLQDCRGNFFTLHFDKSTVHQVKNLLDIYLAFWSAIFKKGLTVLIHSSFPGHFKASLVHNVVLRFLKEKNLTPKLFLLCFTDNPAVYLLFLCKLNEALKSKSLNQPYILVHTGTHWTIFFNP